MLTVVLDDLEAAGQHGLQQTAPVRQELDLFQLGDQRDVADIRLVGRVVGHVGERLRGVDDPLHHDLVPRLEQMKTQLAPGEHH